MTNIGLFGFGCVGQGFYETLKQNDVPAKVTRVVIRDPNKPRDIDHALLSTQANDILEDDDVSIVVELIDDAARAFDITSTAMKKGKSVITANKKMVANHLAELHALARENNVQLFYEGAVCGAIPVIQNLDRYFRSESIQNIEGIVNGSTNYILSKVLDEDLSYADALAQAQEQGFAETDPSLDVDGYDPSYKLRILVWHAFGQDLPLDSIFRRGIRQICKQDVRFARENGWKIKLIARAALKNGRLQSVIAPHFVSSTDPLHYVNNEFNSIEITGAYSAKQTLTGKGAGSLPTGLAVLSDLHAYLNGSTTRNFTNVKTGIADESLQRSYIGFKNASDVEIHLFETIEEHYLGSGDQGYVVGKISPIHLQDLAENDDISIILLPDHLKVHSRHVKPLSNLS